MDTGSDRHIGFASAEVAAETTCSRAAAVSDSAHTRTQEDSILNILTEKAPSLA